MCLLLRVVQQTFHTQALQMSPIIDGVISLTPGVLYTLTVEILQTRFENNAHVQIAIDGNDYGNCYPTCHECCNWFKCRLSTDTLISKNSKVAINIHYPTRIILSEVPCSGIEEARVTLVLKGIYDSSTYVCGILIL